MKKGYLVQSIVSFSYNLKSKSGPADKNPKSVGIVALAITLSTGGAVALAQQPKKVARICYLGGSDVSTSAIFVKPFRERLREIGYVEGQNIAIEFRFSEGKDDRLPELTAELVRLNCDVIVTAGGGAAQSAKNATKTIPVVMAFGPDAVRLGIVADLARPGGNITGLTDMGAQLYGKRLELLKETVPKLARVAFLLASTTPVGAADNVKELETVARYLRVGMQFLEVKGPDDIEGAFRAATKGRANGLMLPTSSFFAFHRKRIIDLAEKNRLPAMYSSVGYVEAGGLMVYSEDRAEMLRRAAEIVDMILKGTKPADMPVERPKKFVFVINLKAAKQIGLTVPPEVLARASRIIR
jgi:putative ABC transport system substrate-binding protein